MSNTFVGFGFGPIQGGLFFYEADLSGNFGRLVAAEVVPEMVAALREAGGYTVNVATSSGVDAHNVSGIEIHNPLEPTGRETLVSAVAEASEVSTALPSVEFFDKGDSSVAAIVAEGLRKKIENDLPDCVIYAAENHNHAAELLKKAVYNHLDPAAQSRLRGRVQFLNTVIGKMSGVVSDDSGLAPVVPGWAGVFLVEEFNRILVSDVTLRGFKRGIEVFIEKPDLLPFEEAKLYGHNATHALIGYLASRKGYELMSEVAADEKLASLARTAFLEESGAALIGRHVEIDELFTIEGYRDYAEDLLARMMNPHLKDLVARVIRDPRRKLGWNDRLVGTMRIALDAGIAPERFALGAAAALEMLMQETGETDPANLLDSVWQDAEEKHAGRKAEVRDLIIEASGRL